MDKSRKIDYVIGHPLNNETDCNCHDHDDDFDVQRNYPLHEKVVDDLERKQNLRLSS